MKAAPASLALLAAALAVGCSQFAPFVTYAETPPATDKRPRIAVCYNALTADAGKVRSAAQAECGADAVAERIDTDYQLMYCPVLLPARATFVCTAKH